MFLQRCGPTVIVAYFQHLCRTTAPQLNFREDGDCSDLQRTNFQSQTAAEADMLVASTMIGSTSSALPAALVRSCNSRSLPLCFASSVDAFGLLALLAVDCGRGSLRNA